MLDVSPWNQVCGPKMRKTLHASKHVIYDSHNLYISNGIYIIYARTENIRKHQKTWRNMYTLYQFSSITHTGVFYHLLNHCLHCLHQLTMALTHQRRCPLQWCAKKLHSGVHFGAPEAQALRRQRGLQALLLGLSGSQSCDAKEKEGKRCTCSVHIREWVAGFSVQIWFRIGTLINKNSQLNASPRFEEQMSWPMAEFAWSFRQSVVLTCVVSFAYRNCPKLIRKIKRAV